VNLNRLTLGGRVVAVAGLLLFIDSFLPWFRVCVSVPIVGYEGRCVTTASGWGNWASRLAVLVTIAMLVQLGLELAGTDLRPPGTFTWAQVQLAAAGVVALLVLIQVAAGDGSGTTRSVGAWLGLVFAAGLVYGAVLRSREPTTPQEWTPPRKPTTS